MAVGDPSSTPMQYTGIDIASMVGGYVGGQQNAAYLNSSASGYASSVWALLPTIIVGNWALDIGLIGVPVALVLTFASFLRWELSLPAGVIALAGCILWIWGVSAIAPEAGRRLAALNSSSGAPPVPVSASLGSYLMVVAGASLLLTYFMTRAERLDPPLD